MAEIPVLKLGRLSRSRDPRVPHLSALVAGKPLPAPLPSIDWTIDMPGNLGAMGNDQLGDCTCAAIYHAIQVWTFNARRQIQTSPDSDVIATYSAFCGYVPGNPATDQGGIEQVVLADWMRQGVQTIAGQQRLAAFVEVDPRNTDDVKRTIADCGICYIGINVPAYLMSSCTAPGATWDVQPSADNSVIGGHAIVLAGYDSDAVRVISWGNYYRMTWAFFGKFCEEAYALADPDWVEATGKTPGGLSLEELETQLQALKEAA